MPLAETTVIDVDEVRQLARQYWDVELGDCIKAAQNHTFHASKSTGERFVLRVTPDPANQRFECTELEVALLEYLHENKLPVCRSICSPVTSTAVVRSGPLILCLFVFATGEPVVFTDWAWMTDREKVVGLGRWCARLHALTRRFTQENPTLAAHGRHWTKLHDGVLAEVQVDERDSQLAADPAHFGLIHGDINPSNYFWDTTIEMPFMFDWDQLQCSWFLYDLSAPIWFVVGLELPGSPFHPIPVPEANSKLFTTWLLEGYESDGDRIVVDRTALQRMVLVRRELYKRFCRRGVNELPADHGLMAFCRLVNDYFDKEEKQASNLNSHLHT